MKKSVLSVLFLLPLVMACSQPPNYENYDVQIPPAFELANIMVALTEFSRQDDNIVKKGTDYHEAVVNYFLPYQNHPAIKKLNQIFNGNRNENYNAYHDWRTGSYEAKFVGKQLKFRSLIRVRNTFKKHGDLIEDFVRSSSFLEFYDEHKPLFHRYVNQYKSAVSIGDMWQWMELQFPQRYHGYKIVLSPLIGGFHNTVRTKSGKETIMFVNVPNAFVNQRQLSSIEKGNMVRTVLTEIDHNYVNPISDNWRSAINDGLANLDCWNQNIGGYDSPVRTFNEYMTWAVFNIYLKEKFDAKTYEEVNSLQANFMADRRGFVKFREFNSYLLALYTNKNKSEKIPDLYPQAIEWFNQQDCD
ncbi:MAG: DUF4932 domain-containing protein [Bacteroidota bacterium]